MNPESTEVRGPWGRTSSNQALAVQAGASYARESASELRSRFLGVERTRSL
jgi:hypothetical protein